MRNRGFCVGIVLAALGDRIGTSQHVYNVNITRMTMTQSLLSGGEEKFDDNDMFSCFNITVLAYDR